MSDGVWYAWPGRFAEWQWGTVTIDYVRAQAAQFRFDTEGR